VTYAELENKIEMIRAQPGSYVGGLAAFSSGRKISLTVAAEKKIAGLEKNLSKLVDDSLDD